MHPNIQSGLAQEVIICHSTAQSSAFNNPAKLFWDCCNLRICASHRPAIPPSSDSRKKSLWHHMKALTLGAWGVVFSDKGLNRFLEAWSCFQLYHLWQDASLYWGSLFRCTVKDLESWHWFVKRKERCSYMYIRVCVCGVIAGHIYAGHIYINFFRAGATPQVGQRSAIVQSYWNNI